MLTNFLFIKRYVAYANNLHLRTKEDSSCPVVLIFRIAPMRPAVFHGGGSFFLSNAGVAAPFETREQFYIVKTGNAAPSKCVRNTGLSLTSFA